MTRKLTGEGVVFAILDEHTDIYASDEVATKQVVLGGAVVAENVRCVAPHVGVETV